MKVTRGEIPDVLVIEPKVWRDERGSFLETWQSERYAEVGIAERFVQDNRSRSVRGTLRGLHAQRRRPQGKLIHAVDGQVFDVLVDLRRDSATYLRWMGLRLDGERALQVWAPPGFAHGFCALSDVAVVEYKCTELYVPSDEVVVAWDDPDLAIDWPVKDPLLSPRDRQGARARDV